MAQHLPFTEENETELECPSCGDFLTHVQDYDENGVLQHEQWKHIDGFCEEVIHDLNELVNFDDYIGERHE